MTNWEKAKARLSVGFMGHVPGGSCEAEKPCLGCDIRSALEEVEDARSYAAEIAQGVSHYPHEEAEPCVRCRAEKAEAEVERLREALSLIGRWNRNTCREESALEFARTALQGGGE